MSHHHHHDCVHSVRYCKRCDTCFCVLCSREWGLAWSYTTTPIFTTTSNPVTTYSGGTSTATTDITVTGQQCDHKSGGY